MGYMRDFLFPPEQARTPIGKLSGGERGRLMLARAWRGSSPTCCSLEQRGRATTSSSESFLDLLQAAGGSARTRVSVSHDRDFLDRVATSVIVGDGDGLWVEYAGGYSDMVAQRGYGLAGPLAAPVEASEKPDRPPPAERATPKRKLGLDRAPRAPTGCLGAYRAAPRLSWGARGEARRRRLSPPASRALSPTRPRLTAELRDALAVPPRPSGSAWRSCAGGFEGQ